MKKTQFLLTAVLALAVAAPMYGQGMGQQMHQGSGMMGGQKMGGGMMGGGMTGGGCGMMAGGKMHAGTMGHGSSVSFYLKQADALGLSDAQVAKLKQIKLATEKAVIRKQADLRIAKLELNELLQNPQAKRSELEAKAKKVQALQSDLWLTQFRARLDARATLTPEQLQKAKALKHGGMGKGMMKGGKMKKGMMQGGMMQGGNAANRPNK